MSGFMSRRSLPAIRGAARIAQRLKWARHSAIADFEHVGIIPMSRPGKGLKSNLLIHDVKHAVATTIAGFPFFLALPSVLDVSRGAPKISYTVRPEPWPASAPFATAEDNRP